MRRLTPAALLLPALSRQLLDEQQLLLCSFLADEELVLVQPANWPAKIPAKIPCCLWTQEVGRKYKKY